jgi:hypothetical protein
MDGGTMCNIALVQKIYLSLVLITTSRSKMNTSPKKNKQEANGGRKHLARADPACARPGSAARRTAVISRRVCVFAIRLYINAAITKDRRQVQSPQKRIYHS